MAGFGASRGRRFGLVVALTAAAALAAGVVARAQEPAGGPAAAAPEAGGERCFESPNLLFTRARIDEVKRRAAAGDAVLKPALEAMVAEARSRLALTPNPIAGALKAPGFYKNREGQRAVTTRIRPEAAATNALATAFAFTGEKEYAEKAKQVLFAWVSSLTHAEDGGEPKDRVLNEHRGDTPLIIAYTFPHFIQAFDLLRGAGALSADETARFRAWLRVFARYHDKEWPIRNNQHDWQSLFLMCAAHALADRPLFDQAVRYYRHGFGPQIRADGGMPLELIRGEKAATYTLMALEAMVQAVHVAAAHGARDLGVMKSDAGGTLRGAIGALLDFVDDPATWRPRTGDRKLDGPEKPGEWGWLLELPRRWWGDERYGKHLAARPYGLAPARAYTLSFATLAFAEPAATGG